MLFLKIFTIVIFFGIVVYEIIKAVRLSKTSKKLKEFMWGNYELIDKIIDKYVDGVYDLDLVIRMSDIDKIRDELNELSKGEFKDLLLCRYSPEANVSNGFYVVKDWIYKIKKKNIIIVR